MASSVFAKPEDPYAVPAKLVSCTECERLTERITQLEKKIETLHQICESEQFIDSVAVTIQGSDGQTFFIQGITTNVEHLITDLADTLLSLAAEANPARNQIKEHQYLLHHLDSHCETGTTHWLRTKCVIIPIMLNRGKLMTPQRLWLTKNPRNSPKTTAGPRARRNLHAW